MTKTPRKRGLALRLLVQERSRGLSLMAMRNVRGSSFISTEKGRRLISVIPDEVKSAGLTAEWEIKLQQIERGQYSHDSFMGEIEEFVRGICGKYGSVDDSVSFGGADSIGNCPKCGKSVIKGKYGYYCSGKCGMNVAKVYGKTLSDSQIAGLLNGKSTSYTANGKKTTVLPEVVSNDYNGKTYYQWKTKRS